MAYTEAGFNGSRHSFADWVNAHGGLHRHGRDMKGPCPVCGGTRRFWVREGDRAEVLARCRHECSSFDELAAALFPRDRDDWRPVEPRPRPRRPVGPTANRTPTRDDPGGPGVTKKLRVKGGLLARRLIEANPPHVAARVWLRTRGLDAERLEDEGWRMVRNWPSLEGTRFEHWPLGIHRDVVVAVPYRNRGGALRGVRFRTNADWRRERENRGLAGPKSLSMPGDKPMLYGVHRLPSRTERLHIAEGEVDTESLAEAGAGSVVGIPGATMLHDRVVKLALDLRVNRTFLWLDADEAGVAGAERLGDALSAAGIETVVGRLPEGRDVNDLLADGSLKDAIEAARSTRR